MELNAIYRSARGINDEITKASMLNERNFRKDFPYYSNVEEFHRNLDYITGGFLDFIGIQHEIFGGLLYLDCFTNGDHLIRTSAFLHKMYGNATNFGGIAFNPIDHNGLHNSDFDTNLNISTITGNPYSIKLLRRLDSEIEKKEFSKLHHVSFHRWRGRPYNAAEYIVSAQQLKNLWPRIELSGTVAIEKPSSKEGNLGSQIFDHWIQKLASFRVPHVFNEKALLITKNRMKLPTLDLETLKALTKEFPLLNNSTYHDRFFDDF